MHVNIIQLNYTKCAINKNTAVHMLGHEGKSSFFKKKGKIMLKQSKNGQTHPKKGNFLSHACDYSMHERPKMCPALFKFTSYI